MIAICPVSVDDESVDARVATLYDVVIVVVVVDVVVAVGGDCAYLGVVVCCQCRC